MLSFKWFYHIFLVQGDHLIKMKKVIFVFDWLSYWTFFQYQFIQLGLFCISFFTRQTSVQTLTEAKISRSTIKAKFADSFAKKGEGTKFAIFFSSLKIKDRMFPSLFFFDSLLWSGFFGVSMISDILTPTGFGTVHKWRHTFV